jgi:hypothetical protein
VLTRFDPQAEAGARALASAHPAKRVVSPGNGDPRGSTLSRPLGGALPGYLDLGPEITARVLRPKGLEKRPAAALVVRFIDTQLLVLPPAGDSAADWNARLVDDLAVEGLHSNVVWAPDGLDDALARRLSAEIVVGGGSAASSTIPFPAPLAGDSLEITSNGAEMHAPGPLMRSRYGHWIDCRGEPVNCGAELDAGPAGGPVLVPLTLPGQAEGTFLVDTRAPLSYLVRPRYETLPGWEKAKTLGDEHSSEPVGAEVAAFPLQGEHSPVVRRWHVLPIEPFEIGGRPIAGIVGMDLLQSFKLTLDTKGRMLTLAPNFALERDSLPPAEKTDAGAWDVPMDHSPKGPLILSTIDGRPASLIVDLGSPETAVFLPHDEWAKKVSSAKPAVREGLSIAGDPDEAAWKKIETQVAALPIGDLNLFGAHFTGRTAVAVDQPLEADVLGIDFLDGFSTVTLDFRRRSILLAP